MINMKQLMTMKQITTMKHLYISILACFASCFLSLYPLSSRAQIGYQVSLLNTATGEPRAGVTVNAAVTITDVADKVVYSGSQQVTSNDFGVLSLVVGNADTFANADYSKLPFFISVSVDGTLIGKSQILSVPVAEYAKRTGELTKEKLVGTWEYKSWDVYWENDVKVPYVQTYYMITFSVDNTCSFVEQYNSSIDNEKDVYEYFIDGNYVFLFKDDPFNKMKIKEYQYIPSKNIIISSSNQVFNKQ